MLYGAQRYTQETSGGVFSGREIYQLRCRRVLYVYVRVYKDKGDYTYIYERLSIVWFLFKGVQYIRSLKVIYSF